MNWIVPLAAVNLERFPVNRLPTRVAAMAIRCPSINPTKPMFD